MRMETSFPSPLYSGERTGEGPSVEVLSLLMNVLPSSISLTVRRRPLVAAPHPALSPEYRGRGLPRRSSPPVHPPRLVRRHVAHEREHADHLRLLPPVRPAQDLVAPPADPRLDRRAEVDQHLHERVAGLAVHLPVAGRQAGG